MNIRTKLTLLLLVVSILVIATAGVMSTYLLDSYFESRIVEELTTQSREFESILRNCPMDQSTRYGRLQGISRAANLRLTLISGDGRVLFESELPEGELAGIENHRTRPEVQDALLHGTGTNARRSATLSIEMLYLARRLDSPPPPESGFADAAVLRIGLPLIQISSVLADIRGTIIIVSIAVMVIVLGISFVVSKRLARPIHEMAAIAEEIRSGSLEKRIPVLSHDEFGKLAESLNSMVDKLNEDIAKLKKLERVRSEFLGNVSHELRTPIFAMQGMLETLLHGALDDREVGRDFLQRTLANTERLNTLLGDLIEISRIESGDMKMSFRYFSLNDFLTQIHADSTVPAGQKDITVSLQLPEAPIDALGDRDRLKQVMVNLIDNGIKYTPQGGRITISVLKERDKVRISVADTGYGIAKEHLPRIFERFYRVDKERSREAGGTGLGLAIVKHIIEAHESTVEVESEPGKGSTFSFTLKTA